MKLPYRDKQGNTVAKDRKVAEQPLRFSSELYNMRKLMELPKHLVGAKDTETFKREVILTFEVLNKQKLSC